ncbi:nuclear pore complex protein Nup50 [Formica exsecta]|uniref:nuclear pore complex protein Nup50 n=1 Tax=Formica exsecta TaxID=72781 RepID=UPI0011426A9A|nr:nuclear pore complex protein Nup50 [Formica exsecta]XP_029666520.1 nuclear pore complex protein Nup50 [Formica exsecta]
MSGKRSATTELNHDNWNEENEPEEAGTFAKAADDILEKRVIKTAKRRFSSRDGAMKSAFGTFAGFKTTPATSSSPFGFLASVSTTSTLTTSAASTTTVNASSRNIASNGSKIPEKDANKMEDTIKAQTLSSTSSSKTILTKKENEKTKRYSSDYYAKLKGLNESVATWIKTHVDANPFCILTPIFKDYEKYLKEITSKESTKTQASHTPQCITQAAQNDNQKDTSTEKKLETSSFDTSNANTKSASTVATEWKPEKSIFSNIAANTKSIFGNTEQRMESPKSVFTNADATSDKGRSIFGNIESNVAAKSIFGNANVESNPFLHKSSAVSDGGKTDEEDATSNTKSVAPTFPVSTFSFGQSSTTNNVTAGFSFGSAKPFSFAPQAVKPQDSEDKTDNENKDKDEEDEEPPKPDFKPVTEEGAVYEQRCKVYIKKNDNFSDRGVGMLYLKPTPNGKTQLIVRADTALGNLLLNILLTQSIPIKRMNKNTIMLVCLPMPDSSPPPVPMLLRVKTSEVADELFETLNKHKK